MTSIATLGEDHLKDRFDLPSYRPLPKDNGMQRHGSFYI